MTGRFATGSLIHQILLGVDYFRQDGEDAGSAAIFDGIPPIDINQPVFGVLPSGFFDSLRNTEFDSSQDDQTGLYFQDDILLWDKVHLLGGGRYDWALVRSGFSGVSIEAAEAEAEAEASEVTEEAFSPRVGLLYQPWPWLSLYGNYAESFGINNGRPAPDEPPLPPETATQYEVGVKTSFFDDALTGTLAFFDLTKQNVLTADVSTPDPFDSRPVGEQRSRGIELDISGQVSEGLSLIASYAYTDTEVTKDDVQLEDGTVTRGNTGNRFIDAPRNAGSVFATYGFQRAPLQGLKLGGGLFAVGQREGNLENTFQLPGYVRVDAVAAYEWIVGPSKITAQLNVENLLDKDYFAAADTDIGGSAVPGAPRTFLGSVRVEF